MQGVARRLSSVAALEAVLAADSAVRSWTWHSGEMSELLSNIDDILVTNQGHAYSDSQRLVAVSPNFFDTYGL